MTPRFEQVLAVVWDNLDAHQRVRARERITTAGWQVVFLPPYSPDVNPIALAFSMLKSGL